ncbi:MAG: hypothetical protein JKY45_10425 [Emcibacter sp.]|nr:hypothetical protein [Emcibacter sp.]
MEFSAISANLKRVDPKLAASEPLFLCIGVKMERGSFSYRLGAGSQFFNAMIGGGNRDQTFSARSYEAWLYDRWWAWTVYHAIDFIFFWQPDHCYNSYLTDPEFTYKHFK